MNNFFAKLHWKLSGRAAIVIIFSTLLFIGVPAHAQQGETDMDLVSNAVDPHAGNWITYTALLTCADARPTGTVTFTVDNVNLPPATIDLGVASISLTFSEGDHEVSAVFTGDSSCTAAHASLHEAVGCAGSCLSIHSSINPSTVGQPVTFSVHCGNINVSNTVKFYDGGTLIDTENNVVFNTSFTTSSLSVGSHTITVTSTNCGPASLPTQIVNAAGSNAVTWCNLGGDGRLNSSCGDRIAVYCNADATPPDIDIWVIDTQSVGHELTAIPLASLMKVTEGSYILALGDSGVIFAGSDAAGDGYAALQGGPSGGTAQGDWLKTFTCKAP